MTIRGVVCLTCSLAALTCCSARKPTPGDARKFIDDVEQKLLVLGVDSGRADWVKSTLDHKMLLNSRDPLARALRALGEPVVTLKGNPTAENIARLVYARARARKLPVLNVRLWETRDSSAQYPGE